MLQRFRNRFLEITIRGARISGGV